MANKKKITTSVVAVATATALLLGGTFAWQSISQTALNEKEATINPGGRLHDDFNGTNKDVYVENFGEEKIFARVRLDEYMEIVMNKGTGVEETEIVTAGATKDETDTYLTHKYDAVNTTDEYFEWTTDGSTVYMPTFNKNKDSLKADINGTLEYQDEEGNSKPYGDYKEYTVGETVKDDAIYDADSNTVDEFEDDSAQENVNYILVNEEHTAKKTENATFISMDEWQNDYNSEAGPYWVYDTDGWVYWAQAIEPDTATGLLLDKIELKNVMDDSYYYAINVVGQFITADDLGKDDNTGFYADAENEPSEAALTLLKAIGVQTDKNALAAGLYDANDKLLCAWEDCGIELNPTEEASVISDEEEDTSASYILEHKYPGTVKIILPDDATSIGDYVFSYCSDLVTVDVKNVETLGNHAFDNCQSLTTVIGSNIKNLGESCFNYCGALTTVDISQIETLPTGVFMDTAELVNLDLSSVKRIEQSALYCNNAKELDLKNVEVLGQAALYCAMAEKVYLDKVTEINFMAFAYMSNLKAIVYKDVAYTNVESLQAALEANGVTIKDYAFEECTFWQPSVAWEWELLDNNGDPTDYPGNLSVDNDAHTEFTYSGELFSNSSTRDTLNFRIANTEDSEGNEIDITGYHLNFTGWLEDGRVSEAEYYYGYQNSSTWVGQCVKKRDRPAYICPAPVNLTGTNYLEIVVEYTCNSLNYESTPLKFTFTGTRK